MRSLIASGSLAVLSSLVFFKAIHETKPQRNTYQFTTTDTRKTSNVTLQNNIAPPLFEGVETKLVAVQPVTIPYLLYGTALLGMCASAYIIDAGIRKTKQEYPLTLAAQLLQYRKAQAALDIESHNLKADVAYEQQGINGIQELTPAQIERQKFLEGQLITAQTVESTVLATKKTQAEVEALRAQIELAKAKKQYQKLTVSSDESPTEIQPKTGDKKKLVNWYLKQAKNHENGWLYALITGGKPLIITGGMGSNKSSFATAIALLQNAHSNREIVQVVDGHAHGNMSKWNLLKDVSPNVEFVGSGGNWDAYIDALLDFGKYLVDNITDKLKVKYITIFDELTNIKNQVELRDVLTEYQARFLDIVTAARKANWQVIIITHTLTGACLPDKLFQTINGASNQIELHTDMAQKSTGTGEFFKTNRQMALKSEPINIPSWLSCHAIAHSLKQGRPHTAKYSVLEDGTEKIDFFPIDWEDDDEDETDDE